jgi:hypothetical protein
MAIQERPHPGDLLSLAFELINARGAEYDNANDIEQNFREAAAVATVVTGKELTARDVALILHCVKLIRGKSSPGKLDNYVDGMNYLAFAACFQGLAPLPILAPVPETSTALAKLAEVADAAE